MCDCLVQKKWRSDAECKALWDVEKRDTVIELLRKEGSPLAELQAPDLFFDPAGRVQRRQAGQTFRGLVPGCIDAEFCTQ